MKDTTDKYDSLNFNVVLVNPEIPNNTGNIGRLCVATNSRLHLIHPLGFEISDQRVKRAGLDYWDDLEISFHESFDHWFDQVKKPDRIFFFSANTNNSIYSQNLRQGDWLVFGKESKGLDTDILQKFQKQTVSIPFPGKVRSFNLSNAVAIALSEGLRQFGNDTPR